MFDFVQFVKRIIQGTPYIHNSPIVVNASVNKLHERATGISVPSVTLVIIHITRVTLWRSGDRLLRGLGSRLYLGH